MRLIVGLGNPGKQYEQTRHNIGFMALDAIADRFGFPAFQENKKFFGLVSEGSIQNEKTLLLKPQTFMNFSGKSVRAAMDFYKISLADISLIHDDVDLELGTYKITENSRSAGHRGVQNVIDTLGTQEFRRCRIGAGPVPENMETDAFVLKKMHDEDLKILGEVFEKILDTF